MSKTNVNMISQEQGESAKNNSENGEDLSSCTVIGNSECSERSPSGTDEASCDSSEKSASIQKYEEEWDQIYYREDPDFGELRRRAVTGNLRASRFRSVCWRALLGVFSSDKNNWLKELRRYRQHYNVMSQEFFIDPWEDNKPEDNPLAQNAESSWHKHFCDNELKAVIKQDVVRTFPGVDFFRKETVQKAMLNILFIYARENPEMCYRQGMHEILAPLLFVLHCDHQALLHTKEQVSVSDAIAETLDPEFLEADAYSIFCFIMDAISCYYKINDTVPTATGYFPPNLQSPIPPAGASRKENEILAQLESIKDNLLFPNDRELAEYLNRLEITLPVFGIRWLRLLFGREFSLQDLLVLWDAIFAEGRDFGLVNYIVVAMLVAIRNQLLDADYTTCLMHLMRYPGTVDITYIIEHALYLKDPQTHGRPPASCFPVHVRAPLSSSSTRMDAPGTAAGPPGRQLRRQQQTQRVVVRGRADKAQQRKAASSTPSGSSLSERFKKLSTRPSHWAVGKGDKALAGRGDGDPGPSSAPGSAVKAGIVEGFTLNDPALLAAELEHARAVMSLCRLKLAQYQGVLAEAINSSRHPEAQQALDGINELCGLLSSRTHLSQPPEVEPAYEAGELRVDPVQQHQQPQHQQPQQQLVRLAPPSAKGGTTRRTAVPPSQLPLRPPAPAESMRQRGAAAAPTHAIVAYRNLMHVQMETFREGVGAVGESTRGYPLVDPLKTIKPFDYDGAEWPNEHKIHAASFLEFK